jgi:hypothetical protein
MVESARAHHRLEKATLSGLRFTINDVLPTPVEVFVPAHVTPASPARLLIHFLGAAYIPEDAAAKSASPTVVASIHLGAGSAINERPFRDDPALFARLVQAIRAELESRSITVNHIDLSAFSAGYGSIRAILRSSDNVTQIHGVLLLDGLHTSFIPEGKPLAEGGKLDTTLLDPFVDFARLAIGGEKALVVTHSEIFPGTFASTTETSDYLLEKLGVDRKPVLKWGPMGMQQLSEAKSGEFHVLGFAGNTAPDHLDHSHGMSGFLRLLD